MSGGTACACAERQVPIAERLWVVRQFCSNHSAFNGYRETSSDYSAISCLVCDALWRTKAKYVSLLGHRLWEYRP